MKTINQDSHLFTSDIEMFVYNVEKNVDQALVGSIEAYYVKKKKNSILF